MEIQGGMEMNTKVNRQLFNHSLYYFKLESFPLGFPQMGREVLSMEERSRERVRDSLSLA